MTTQHRLPPLFEAQPDVVGGAYIGGMEMPPGMFYMATNFHVVSVRWEREYTGIVGFSITSGVKSWVRFNLSPRMLRWLKRTRGRRSIKAGNTVFYEPPTLAVISGAVSGRDENPDLEDQLNAPTIVLHSVEVSP